MALLLSFLITNRINTISIEIITSVVIGIIVVIVLTLRLLYYYHYYSSSTTVLFDYCYTNLYDFNGNAFIIISSSTMPLPLSSVLWLSLTITSIILDIITTATL